ncbi:uncharacterized protein LOC110009551 [Jatropha curcas]|uniref:uncharacterized protein LOC110009551 n=1 Tax=Jatropha curcas TaxID=180498 RepID=UPI001894FA49|nr:uncharacterized protein LOC110009551 [Jatropha curcas]
MLSTKPQPWLLLLPTLFLISSTFLSLSQAFEFQGTKNEDFHAVIRGIETLNSLNTVFEGTKGIEKNSTIVILAAERTHRKDPLQNFEYYTGGWDYKNNHYWASVAFSAAPLFITAVVWFVLLGLFLLFACICCCCCRHKKTYGYSPIAYALSLIFLTLATAGVSAGCIVLYVNQEHFNDSIADCLEFVLQEALSILNQFLSILNTLSSACKLVIDEVPVPDDIKHQIDVVDQMMLATANISQIQSVANAKNIRNVLSPTRLALDIVASVMLVLVFLGFLFSLLGRQCCIYILVTLAWILVTVTFILCGIFLILHNVVADTCVAVDDWLENPRANASLSLQFLPCLDNKTTAETIRTTKETSSYVINILNRYIMEVPNKDMQPNAGIVYHNQSGPLVPLLCNPFNPDLTERDCNTAEVNFNNVAQEWQKYICQVSEFGICNTTGRLTPKVYGQMTAAVNVSYKLYTSDHLLLDIGECKFVLRTFRKISEDYCPGLRMYSFRTYAGLVTVGASAMCALIMWIVYGRERQKRNYTKKMMDSKEQNPFDRGGA